MVSDTSVIQHPSKRRLQFFRTVSFFKVQANECCTASAAGHTAEHGTLQKTSASLLLKKKMPGLLLDRKIKSRLNWTWKEIRIIY